METRFSRSSRSDSTLFPAREWAREGEETKTSAREGEKVREWPKREREVLLHHLFARVKAVINSTGTGNTMVEFFSAEMDWRVCRYLSCRAAGDAMMISLACRKACADFCSPSAAITFARASLHEKCKVTVNAISLLSPLPFFSTHLAASASAAIALCS